MRRFRRLKHILAAARQRARFERDLGDELREHVRKRTEDLQRSGLSPADASRQAKLEFGALESYKEQCRDAQGFVVLRPFLGLYADVTLAARRLIATPLFLTFAVVSLALGVSVTTTVYSTLYAVFWKPLGIGDPAGVALVTSGWDSWRNAVSEADFEALRQRQQSFSHLTASTRAVHTVETPRRTEIATVEAVAGNYFETLRVQAAFGRVIQPGDDPRQPVAVLSDRLWRARFNRDRSVLGSTIRIGLQSFEIIGVAPASFTGLVGMTMEPAPAAWIPLALAESVGRTSPGAIEHRERRTLTVAGRLVPGRAVASASAEVAAIGTSLDGSAPARVFSPGTGAPLVVRRSWTARNATTATRPPTGGTIDGVLIAMMLLVLLVACTNLANLMLSRGALRLHEIAVRRALGASRWRLVRELTIESSLIAVLGGVLTAILTRAFLAMAATEIPTPGNPLTIAPELNGPALLFAAAALLVSLLVFGLEPALSLTRRTVSVQLASEAGAGPILSGRRQRSLIRWQVAISACFFIVAAVLGKVAVVEARNDSGIALDRLALAAVHFGVEGWDQSRAQRVLERALALARTEKAIDDVAVATGMPFGLQMTPSSRITTPDRPFVKGFRPPTTGVVAGTPTLLRTLDVKLLSGRQFDDRDDAGSRNVVVLSEFTARALFGSIEVLGRTILLQDSEKSPVRTFEVVGIARPTDVDRLMERDDNLVYIPFAQDYRPNVVLVARTSGDPAAATAALHRAMRGAATNAPIGTSGAAYWLLAGPYAAARIGTLLAAALGLLTLILAMVGLYGVQAQVVTQRTREVGVRMALGAEAAQIQQMVLRQGFIPVTQGLMIGLCLGTLVRAGLRAWLTAPVQVFDPVAFAVVPIPLALAAFLACFVPAWRASRVDPNVALRHL